MKKERALKKEIGKQYSRAIFFTICPLIIPFIFLIPDIIINSISKWIISLLLLGIDVYFVLKLSKQDAYNICKAEQVSSKCRNYQISKTILNRLSNCETIKGNLIKDETYHPSYDYRKNILLYNPHQYIERVCEELKSLIAEITNIELEYISVAFIYQYPLYAKDELSNWKWITGKNTTSGTQLKDFVKQKDTYFHYLITQDISADFENDKSKLFSKHYHAGEKDLRHNETGSIFGTKVSFKNNNFTFCTGYLVISSYGKKFCSELNDNENYKTENEFKEILFDSVLPPFRHLMETELGFMYMRHKHRGRKPKK